MHRKLLISVLSVLFLIDAGSPFMASGQSASDSNPAARALEYQPLPHEKWNHIEIWAWQKIRSGKTADFSKIGPGRFPLRSSFLKNILSNKRYRDEIPNQGIYIIGARFEKELDFDNVKLEHQIAIENSHFMEPVNLNNITSAKGISFENSIFYHGLTLSWSEIGGVLNLTGTKFWRLRSRDIPFIQDEEKTSHILQNGLLMRGMKVKSSILLDRANLNMVDLQMAMVSGHLSMRHSTIGDRFQMALAHEIQEINMVESTFNDEVLMPGIKVKSNLLLDRTVFRKKLDMEGVYIGLNLSMEQATVYDKVDLKRAYIGGKLSMVELSARNNKKGADRDEFRWIEAGAGQRQRQPLRLYQCPDKSVRN